MINDLITRSEKMTALLKEYKESQLFEKCTCHIVQDPGSKVRYFLVLVKEGKIVCDGINTKILSYLRLRSIDPDLVYNYSLLNS